MSPSAHLGLSGLQEPWLVGCMGGGGVLLLAVGDEDCLMMGEMSACKDLCNL